MIAVAVGICSRRRRCLSAQLLAAATRIAAAAWFTYLRRRPCEAFSGTAHADAAVGTFGSNRDRDLMTAPRDR